MRNHLNMALYESPENAPAGELIRLAVTDGITTWEAPHNYILDKPSGQFYPHRINKPISHTLTVVGWRYAVNGERV